MSNKWFTFATKMKWVGLAALTGVLGTAGTELTNTFPPSENPWVAVVIPALVFVAGYIPKDKTASGGSTV